ncbi:hypothetical protein [Salinicola lusitanus]|nr:hypothetical protein [Salinicola lusitanus]
MSRTAVTRSRLVERADCRRRQGDRRQLTLAVPAVTAARAESGMLG